MRKNKVFFVETFCYVVFYYYIFSREQELAGGQTGGLRIIVPDRGVFRKGGKRFTKPNFPEKGRQPPSFFMPCHDRLSPLQ